MAKAIDIVDGTFDASQSENYHLSIQTEGYGLSFCVFDTLVDNYIEYIVLRNYSLSINDPNSYVSECKAVFENDEILKLKYKSSSHLWISPRCTVVPEPLFDNEYMDLYLNFNHGAVKSEKTLYNHVAQANLYNVFSYHHELIDLLKSYHPNISLYHQATPFLKSIINAQPSTGRQDILAVSFYSGNLDIGVVDNKRLLFYNTFQINAPADSVYYLLVVSNLFNIDLKSTKLLYYGNNEQMPPEISILSEYVESIIDCEPSAEVTYCHNISEPYRKRFVNLFNLYGCE